MKKTFLITVLIVINAVNLFLVVNYGKDYADMNGILKIVFLPVAIISVFLPILSLIFIFIPGISTRVFSKV